MAKDTKFGTFAGVYTPSVLTILGVIMYMRLPWIVGNAGMYMTVGIILVAHVISVTTGLSISSIATDKRVGAGGPYYIVSRSLGLPIGGTLGIALFLGIAFSISLYVIGFSESFLAYWQLGISPTTGAPTLNAIRICGTVTILLLTIVTFVSTSLAIKTQYLILGAIALSLGSIFLGSSPVEMTGPVLQPAANGAAIGTIFGIFFPAVTGFTAGVNMSGDLRDPNRSIPKGTMGAIATGLVVYLGLAIYMAMKIPQDRLINDTTVLLDIALSPHLVLAGIWGATLSSALGSILGAPRIMQAVAGDRIAPRFLSKGHGPSNEPRNALFLAFAIGEAGILVAKLDVIAAVVSMVFLATYGFLNLSCAIESWASPDFRPQFRIPKLVSIVGAITTVLIMIQIDIVSMLAAAAGMTGLFFYLKRRQLTLETGDTWESIWSSLVRSGLSRLGRSQMHQRNWRPNLILFDVGATKDDSAADELARALVASGGVLTQFRLLDKAVKTDDDEPAPATPGVFLRDVVTSAPMQAMAAICEHHGYPALRPNTVVMDWNLRRGATEDLPPLLQAIAKRDMNVLWVAENRRRGRGEAERIDFWWRAGRGNLPLAIAIGRFLTATGRWRSASVRILLVADEQTDIHGLPIATQKLLQASRLEARVQVVREGLHGKRFEDIVALESKRADLTVLGLSDDDENEQGRIDELLESLGTTVLYRASSVFSDVEVSSRPVARASAPAVGDIEDAAEALRLPSSTELAVEAKRFDRAYSRAASSFLDGAAAGMGSYTDELVHPLRNVIKKQLDQLEAAIGAADDERQRKSATRAERAVLFRCHRLLQTYTAEALAKQQATFESQIQAFLSDCSTIQRRGPKTLRVQRSRDDMRSHPADTRHIAQFKRWKRIESVLLRRPPEYEIPVEPLTEYHVESGMDTLLRQGVVRLQADQHQLAVELGKVLSSLRGGLVALRVARDAGQSMAPFIAAERERSMQGLEQLEELARDQVRNTASELGVEARRVAQVYADDLDRFDIARRVHKDRKPGLRSDALRQELSASAEQWVVRQRLLLEETSAELLVASMQHRVSASTQRMRDAVVGQIRAGLVRQYAELIDKLTAFRESMDKTTAPMHAAGDLRESFDARIVLDELIEDTNRSVAELPETISKLADETVAGLLRGDAQAVEVTSLPLRRTVQFLLESEFLAGVQDALTKVPIAERRGISVAEEVLRLVSFQQSDLEADDLSDEARREQLRPVIDDGVARIQAELETLDDAFETLQATLDEHLAEFVRGTDPMALATAAGSLEQQVRSREGRKAVSGLRRLEERVSSAASRAMVTVLYRKSSGVLAARQMGGTARTERVVGHVLRQVNAHVPKPAVLDALPFYYRQLFLGQTGINESFWVGRTREIALAEDAVEHFRRGARGALVVTGEAGAGKTALCTMVANRFFDPMRVFRVLPPRGGSLQPLIFRVALERAAQLTGDPHQVVQSLPRHSVVIIDDLELWWERSAGGQAVLEGIAKLIEAHGGRCFFILGVNTQPFIFINRFVGLAGLALSVIECGPVDAEAIKSVVMVRHRSTGRKLRLGKRTEDDLSEWRLARLFNSYFDYAHGNLAAALLAWIAHIEAVHDDEVEIRIPVAVDPEMLEQLRPEWLALLQQFVLHKQLTRSRLARITSLEPAVLREQMSALLRMGLLVETRQGVIEINRYLQHLVSADLARRGHLA